LQALTVIFTLMPLLLLLLQVPVPRPNYAAVRCTQPKGLEPCGDELHWPPRQQADATRNTAAATCSQLVRLFNSFCLAAILMLLLHVFLWFVLSFCYCWLLLCVTKPCGDELHRPTRQQADTSDTTNTAAATSTQLVRTILNLAIVMLVVYFVCYFVIFLVTWGYFVTWSRVVMSFVGPPGSKQTRPATPQLPPALNWYVQRQPFFILVNVLLFFLHVILSLALLLCYFAT
jgi:hypothetical protein